MRLLIGLLIAFATAVVVGLGATWLSLSRSIAFGAITIGAWTSWPRTGTTSIDPYAKATFARRGDLPIGSGDGVGFWAYADDEGRTLDGRCEVTLGGATPPARFWTLTMYDPEGRLVTNAVGRYGFTSQEITRNASGRFDIVAAPQARPGNWLPTGGIGEYVLVLRLYDTPVGVATRAGRETPMPAVTTRGCQ